MTPSLVVVGGGVAGLAHAAEALERGFAVTQLEADERPHRASARNFGLVWVTGQASGNDLELALAGRERWAALERAIPGLPLRASGSLVVARTRAELSVLEELAEQPDATARGVSLLSAREARERCEALAGRIAGALHGRLDAVLEPQGALAALAAWLARRDGYRLLAPRRAVEIEPGRVRDDRGEEHRADAVILCPGDQLDLCALLDPALPARLVRCRLQMLETEPLPSPLEPALLDGGALRTYPAFRLPSAQGLPARSAEEERWRVQLILVQRSGGAVTVGDTHEYGACVDFALAETPYRLLRASAVELLGTPLPPVRRRWGGSYVQCKDGAAYLHAEPEPGVHVVTGLAGRGMTVAPAVARATLDALL